MSIATTFSDTVSVGRSVSTSTTLCSAAIMLAALLTVGSSAATGGGTPTRPSSTNVEPSTEPSFEQELAVVLLSGCDKGDRFEDQGDGTILDCNTDLVWIKNHDCPELDGLGGTWPESLSKTQLVADGNCGLTDGSKPGDWRVPNVSDVCTYILEFKCLRLDSVVATSLINANFDEPPLSNSEGTGQWTPGDPFEGLPIPDDGLSGFWAYPPQYSNYPASAHPMWFVSYSHNRIAPLSYDNVWSDNYAYAGKLNAWVVRDRYLRDRPLIVEQADDLSDQITVFEDNPFLPKP